MQAPVIRTGLLRSIFGAEARLGPHRHGSRGMPDFVSSACNLFDDNLSQRHLDWFFLMPEVGQTECRPYRRWRVTFSGFAREVDNKA